MPRELIATAPGKAELREYKEAPLGEDDIRIKVEFASPKHGTESHNFKSDNLKKKTRFDSDYRIFLPMDEPRDVFPRKLGNMAVGVVTETGSRVEGFKPGDRVYGHMAVRETHLRKDNPEDPHAEPPLGSGVRESRLHHMPEGIRPEDIVLADPCHFALAAVRDASVRVGEWVAVFGLGAIGLMIVQLVKRCGAERIFAVDPLENRRNIAARLGAEKTFDPTACDVGREIKALTGTKGVDVAIDASGSYRALQAAMRTVHYSGLLVTCSYYHGDASPLRLDEEFFLGRITIRASMPVWGNPCRDYPMWDDERIEDTVYRMIVNGNLDTDGFIDPISSFDECHKAYMFASEHPEKCVKLGIRF